MATVLSRKWGQAGPWPLAL